MVGWLHAGTLRSTLGTYSCMRIEPSSYLPSTIMLACCYMYCMASTLRRCATSCSSSGIEYGALSIAFAEDYVNCAKVLSGSFLSRSCLPAMLGCIVHNVRDLSLSRTTCGTVRTIILLYRHLQHLLQEEDIVAQGLDEHNQPPIQLEPQRPSHQEEATKSMGIYCHEPSLDGIPPSTHH